MDILILILFFLSAFLIFWAMIGYPLSIKIISRIFKSKIVKKDYLHQPTVTVMVVAHNEEKVIFDKLNNIIQLNYPKESIQFIISSDNSTDDTNKIIKKFIIDNPQVNIRLYEVKERKGKTNAQNEAQKVVSTEYLVMTDANSILDKNAVRELMATFTSNDIAYVTGRLVFINQDISQVSSSESSYWDGDLAIREIEGRIQTITAGNGALYACRNDDYHDFELISSHDSSMPLYYALNGKRAITNHDAVAYEKAGENIEDEFKRKVRMNRIIIRHILPDIRILNIFKYKWFSYFYFGHRTCRYLLWISHLIVIITNILLVKGSWVFLLLLAGQLLFYLLAVIKVLTKYNNKYLNLIYYYVITVAAQWAGVYRIITGKAKPFWEKAESTR
jgi:glycosyltransferase involved in cell wall biosynthesis